MRGASRASVVPRGLAGVVLLPCALAAQTSARETPVQVREARIDVAIDSLGHATVRERFTLASARPLGFTYLALPCAPLGAIDARNDGAPIALASTARTPWVHLTAHAASTHELAYDVAPRGDELAIPLLVPDAPLVRGAARGAPSVQLTVQAPANVRVRLPRMARAASDAAWSTELIAAPSVVRIALPRSATSVSCDAPLPGDAGRFALLVGCFIGTLVVWVPLYLWWAARRPDAA